MMHLCPNLVLGTKLPTLFSHFRIENIPSLKSLPYRLIADIGFLLTPPKTCRAPPCAASEFKCVMPSSEKSL